MMFKTIYQNQYTMNTYTTDYSKLLPFFRKQICLFLLIGVLGQLAIINTANAQCGNISPTPITCPQVVVGFPYQLNFTGAEGGVLDINGAGTGFRMIDPHTATRLAADQPVSNPIVPGYEPSKIEIAGGNLQLTSSQGLAYLRPPAGSNNNTQVNTLGVGLQVQNRRFMIQSTLINPVTGTGFAQAGIWYGLNEDNFVKLDVVNNNAIEMRIERNGLSGNGTADYIQLTGLAITGNNVRLRLEVNNTTATKTVTGYYQIGTNQEVSIGTFNHTFHNGLLLADGITNNVSFAGIYNSHRSGSQFTAVYDNFIIQDFLSFNPKALNYSLEPNQFQGQIANLSASIGTPTYTLTKSASTPWLTLPATGTLGDLNFVVNTTGYNAGNVLQATVTASAAGYLDAILVINVAVVPEVMEFRPTNLHFTLRSGSGNVSKNIELFSTGGAIPVTLIKGVGATWLTLPTNPVSGNLAFTVNTAGLNEGDTRTTTVTASAAGYTDAILNVRVQMVGLNTTLQFNFQDAASTPVLPWRIDFGQSFGPRIGTQQGFALNYGWKTQSTGLATDLTNRGRLRTNPAGNLIQRTLMHMQLSGNFFWELEIPNGFYQAELSAGDGIGAIDSNHNIRVEGETVIRNFVPTPNQFQTSSAKVEISDGRLTLDAVGGTNTKINSLILTPINNKLIFDKEALNFVLYTNEASQAKSIGLSAETGVLPAYVLSQFQTLPTFLNSPTYIQVNNTDPANLQISIDATGLVAGYYVATLRADANLYLDAEVTIKVRVLDISETIQVNFQLQSTIPPAGWIRDFGQAYGLRTDANQSNGLTYGWVENSEAQNPVNLVGNGRNRDETLTGTAILDATLMHLQYDDIAGPFGIPTEGIWEIELPNGIYEVTTRVGDFQDEGTNNTIHFLNVEYLPFVKKFQQSPGNNFLTVTDFVNVRDGRLTVDAIGGFNTKINTITIRKADQQFLSFDQNILNIIAESGEELADVFANLSASIGSPAITLTESVASGWLTLPGTAALGDLGFNVDVTGLESDVFYTTVVAQAPGYVKAPLRVKLRVANINWTYKINFMRNGADPFTGFSAGVPTGYVPDYGYAYGNALNPYTYGWVDLGASPAVNTVSTQYRNITGVDVRINTLNHMQHPTNPHRNWEIALPVGVYYVKIVAGDPDPTNQNSINYITAEGVLMTDFDQANEPGFYREIIKVVEVTDGKLSISSDPILGTNTKISYIHIGPYELTIDLDKITKPTLVGATNRRMMRLNLDKNVDANISANSFVFNIGGSNPSNITQAKLYYTTDNPLFSTPALVGTPVISPTGSFNFSGLNQSLIQGNNYFWLVYDVSPNATLGESLKIECTTISAGFANYTPTQIIPGGRLIMKTDTIPDKVVSFANAGDYLEVAPQIILSNQLTLEGWIHPNQGNAESKWVMGEIDGVHFEQFGDEIRFYVYSEGQLQGPATAIMPLNEWNHIVGTYDGTTLRIYVNGFEGSPALLISGNSNQPNKDQNQPFTFAAQNELEAPNNVWIDEVRLWSTARTLKEIRENMHLVSTGLEADLISYWQFNQDAINPELYDLVGDNTSIKKGTITPLQGFEPIGTGTSATQIVNTGNGVTPTIFGTTDLEITFGADNPGDEVVVTYLYNSPLGTEANSGFDKMPGYWIVNNFGDNDIDPFTMKFTLKEDAVLSLNPNEFFLHKRGSRESGNWLFIQNQFSDVTVSLGNNPGNNFITFTPGAGNASLKSFSQFVISSDQKPLPVTFLGIQARRIEAQIVEVSWQTLQEVNHLRYEIEFSKEGSLFDKIGEQEGSNQANEIRQYTFLHQNTQSGYYRIKQIDTNSKATYSNSVFVSGGEMISAEVYPNPTVEKITLRVNGIDTDEVLNIQLIDLNGKSILTKIGNTAEVEQIINHQIPFLKQGMYILTIQTATERMKIKIIKQ
jgi:hypothetical protein